MDEWDRGVDDDDMNKKQRGRVQWVRERDESFWIQLFILLLLCAVMNMLNAMQHETRLDTKPKLLFFNCIFHLILLSIGGNRIKETQMANLLVLLCYFVRISSTMSILLYKLFCLLPPLIIHDRQVAFQRAIKVKAKTLTTTEKKKPRGLLIRLFLLFSKQLVSWECWAHTRQHDPARSSRATATRFRWIFIAYIYCAMIRRGFSDLIERETHTHVMTSPAFQRMSRGWCWVSQKFKMKTLLNLLRFDDGERYISEADNKQQRALHHHNIMRSTTQQSSREMKILLYTFFCCLIELLCWMSDEISLLKATVRKMKR